MFFLGFSMVLKLFTLISIYRISLQTLEAPQPHGSEDDGDFFRRLGGRKAPTTSVDFTFNLVPQPPTKTQQETYDENHTKNHPNLKRSRK